MNKTSLDIHHSPEVISQPLTKIAEDPVVGDMRSNIKHPVMTAITEVPLVYKFEILDSTKITPGITRDVARGFREIFANVFEEFVVCQDCQKTMSASKVFCKSSAIPLREMDDLHQLPTCPCCQKTMELFHDPQQTERKLAKKFEKNAHLVLLRAEENAQILGVTFGYKSSLKEVFENEWAYKFTYTATPNPQARRDYQLFLDQVIPSIENDLRKAGLDEVKIDENSQIFCWNCYFLNPQVQFYKLFPKLTKRLAESLPDDYAQLGVIGETIMNSNSHNFLQLVGGSTVPQVLGGDYVLVTASILAGRQNLSQLRSRNK